MLDYVGGMDIVGADDATALLGLDDGVGAVAPSALGAFRGGSLRGALESRRRGQAVLREALETAHNIKRANLAKAKDLPAIPLPIDSASQAAAGIAAAATLGITSASQVPCRITGLSFASSIAPFFSVNSVTIARLSLLGGAGAVPMEIFAGDAWRPPVETPILAAGSQAICSVTNNDAAAHRAIGNYWTLDLTPASARMI